MIKGELKKYDKIVLGIDPGTNVMGYAVIGIKNNKAELIIMDAVVLKKIADSYLKLIKIYEKVLEIAERYLPDEMAIEAQFYGKNVQSMLKLGRAQGVAIAAALSRQIPVSEYEPRKIKLAITGTGSAGKEQVKEMVMRLLNLSPQDICDRLDASDALAIALCHFFECNKVIKTSSSSNWKEFIKNNPERVKQK